MSRYVRTGRRSRARRFDSRFRWTAALVSIVLIGCRADMRRQSAIALHSKYREAHAGFSPQELGWIKQNCVGGLPQKMQPFGETFVIPREGFVLEHSTQRKIPLWVCEAVTKDRFSGPAAVYKRKDLSPSEPFRADDKLSEGKRAELPDYAAAKAVYARGHMSPVGNIKDDLADMADTFVLSNMVPQERANNSGIWASLEGKCRHWATQRGTVWVFTGGFLYDPQEDAPATADGVVEYWVTDSENEVTIPTHLYKIVVAQRNDGKYEAMGFVLENRAYPGLGVNELSDAEYMKSIDWIEDHTGLDFLQELPDDEESALEAAAVTSLWP